MVDVTQAHVVLFWHQPRSWSTFFLFCQHLRQKFIAVLLRSLGYSSRQNLHTAKCELSSFVTVFSVLRFSCSFFSMNESRSATEGQSTKQTGQTTPAVHDKDDPWSKHLTNHAFNT